MTLYMVVRNIAPDEDVYTNGAIDEFPLSHSNGGR